MTKEGFFVVFSVFFVMVNHSWANNALSCSIKRFQILLYETRTSVMLDKGKNGRDYWDCIMREKETARKLNDINFNYNLYFNYDY